MSVPTGGSAVPVYNCVVHISRPATDGTIVARVANLAGIEVCGRNEREALSQAVAAFKTAVSKYHTAGESIPWLTNLAAPAADHVQRFVAVHL